MIYTATRLAVPIAALSAWVWLADGTVLDPANLLLVVGFASTALALSSIRRYWHIRNTSRSRRDSSLLT